MVVEAGRVLLVAPQGVCLVSAVSALVGVPSLELLLGVNVSLLETDVDVYGNSSPGIGVCFS